MDEKTAELRDIFVETTGEDSVTEGQSDDRGSLVDESDRDERLRELLEQLREQCGFSTALDTDAHERIVRAFCDGADDEEILDRLTEARDDLDVDHETVVRARLDLHLVRASDREAPFDFSRLRRLVREDVPLDERAERLDADEATVAHYSRVVEADLAATRLNERFRDGFAELLSDADLADRLASDARRDGLEEATEGLETDVQL
ncbi:MAG: conditioned medium-induced protein 4 [Halobaculum sp.]|jgi:hypothetical protein